MKEFKYKVNGNEYKVVVNDSEGSVLDVEVNGTLYKVETEKAPVTKAAPVKRPARAASAAPVQSAAIPAAPKATSAAAGKAAVKSPLPGTIVGIRCKVGDTVKKGQTILILEAMKMENNVLANADGSVTEILVQMGQSVQEGDNLVVIG
ncbi:biotin/lipoyl-containing protein [Limibacterium fermenti]|jgi:biotin carboxyl carrier protein|uniref:biotin/lipoyl-containing protein n=1 Tax=Limibacterium fermenti TaxID=3229863 RepID=UPI000E91168C|nr:acetyl-CoA carboxylase biotin carboxyl carrier protein subunit [Porphyromonadaceae bacterium]HBK32438.1 acetyl-CoA carboxylase biotin carboxyl carrier protein subunit [Porphyromonadaceae bacterium]HBX21206.1 acetyl-CoA carboxylase biotin carboxyl carrier protein subunit [Porphyromonadaceae bacterium]HBX45956.1 acetyl-CoA carboxylase biotin carboxyl carrier protein subunit [Porphyromonadaceae bacterium]